MLEIVVVVVMVFWGTVDVIVFLAVRVCVLVEVVSTRAPQVTVVGYLVGLQTIVRRDGSNESDSLYCLNYPEDE